MNKKNLMAVLAVYFLTIGNSAVSGALQSIMEAFPNEEMSSVFLILTLPTVFTIPASMLSGYLTSHKVRYKTLALVGTVIFVVSGTVPYFLNSLSGILVSRAILGVGLGLLNPMGNTLSILYFGPEKGGTVIGFGNTSMNLGGLVLQLMGGILCGIGWRNTFLVHLLGILPVLVILFCMEEPPQMAAPAPEKRGKGPKIPPIVFLLGIILMLGQMFIYPIYLNLSTIVITEIPGGTPALSAALLSVVSVAGMVAGAVFGQLSRITKKFSATVGFLTGTIGLYILYTAGTLVTMGIGCAFVGLCNTLLLCSIIGEVSQKVSQEQIPQASGLVMSIFSLAPIIATGYVSLVSGLPNAGIRTIMLVGAVACLISAVLWTLASMAKKQK